MICKRKKIKIKSDQKLKFDMTYKIKTKAIKINNNENTTDWKENGLFLHKKNDVKNETLIF